MEHSISEKDHKIISKKNLNKNLFKDHNKLKIRYKEKKMSAEKSIK